MINLALVAKRKPKQIYAKFDDIVTTIEKGSVITQDNGIKTLAIVASVEKEYNQRIFPYLIEQLKTCRPKSVAQYAESIYVAVNPANQDSFIDVLDKRLDDLSPTQKSRVTKILRKLQER